MRVIYTSNQFLSLLEAYLEEKEYHYTKVEKIEIDEKMESLYDFEVKESLPTKTYGYEEFVDTYGEFGYQEKVVKELFGPLVSYTFNEKNQTVEILFPKV